MKDIVESIVSGIVFVLCTPFGWIGMIILGAIIHDFVK